MGVNFSSRVNTLSSSTASLRTARGPVRVSAVLSSVKSVTNAPGLCTRSEAIATSVCSQKKSFGELVRTKRYLVISIPDYSYFKYNEIHLERLFFQEFFIT